MRSSSRLCNSRGKNCIQAFWERETELRHKILWRKPQRTGFAAPPAATKNWYCSYESLTSPGGSYNPRQPSLSPAAGSSQRVWPKPNTQVSIPQDHLTTCYHGHRAFCFQPSLCFISGPVVPAAWNCCISAHQFPALNCSLNM